MKNTGKESITFTPMKQRFSLTIDEDVYDTIRLQATILDMSLSRYINKILRDTLNVQNEQIEAALLRLKRKVESKRKTDELDGTSS